MTFEEALALQPQWVQLWVMFMSIVLIGSVVMLLISKATRRDALIVFLANVPNVLLIQWLYDQLGYVRLLGLPHVLFWTPLVFYLFMRLKNHEIVTPFRQVIWLLLITITVSLVFDYDDVARY
nr:hypothetical protein [Hyphomicrobiales bacterium]